MSSPHCVTRKKASRRKAEAKPGVQEPSPSLQHLPSAALHAGHERTEEEQLARRSRRQIPAAASAPQRAQHTHIQTDLAPLPADRGDSQHWGKAPLHQVRAGQLVISCKLLITGKAGKPLASTRRSLPARRAREFTVSLCRHSTGFGTWHCSKPSPVGSASLGASSPSP